MTVNHNSSMVVPRALGPLRPLEPNLEPMKIATPETLSPQSASSTLVNVAPTMVLKYERPVFVKVHYVHVMFMLVGFPDCVPEF